MKLPPLLLLALLLFPGCVQARFASEPHPSEELPTLEHRIRRRGDTRIKLSEWDELVFPDGRRLRHGAERSFHVDGGLKHECHYTRGEPSGLTRSWFANGQLRSRHDYDASGDAAVMEFWHESGAPAGCGPAVDGLREGAWTFWHRNGQVSAEGTYLLNRREGHWKVYYQDGSLEASGRYAQAQRVGVWEHREPPVKLD